MSIRMSEKLFKLFVYGTLKKGQPNNFVLTNKSNGHAEFFSNATTTIKLPLVIATKFNVPFLLNKPGHGDYVVGEIYEIDEKMMGTLDEFEGFPDVYDKKVQDMNLGIGEGTVPCWIYLLKNYPEKLLQYPTFSEYTDKEDCKYVIKSKRENPSLRYALNSLGTK